MIVNGGGRLLYVDIAAMMDTDEKNVNGEWKKCGSPKLGRAVGQR
jgi:hypothetical protein